MEHKGQVPHVLDMLHRGGFPSAIVAGGAIRDAMHRVPVKDIDVFVSYEDYNKNIGFTTNPFEACLFRQVIMCNWSKYFKTPDVHLVFEMEHKPLEGEIPVQIIVLNEGIVPKLRIDTHDFGLCQIAFDGKTVLYTEAYVIDKKNKTFTLIYCENQEEFDRSMRRYVRFMEKYPSHNIIITEKHIQYMGLPC